jgi:hypothetical protein
MSKRFILGLVALAFATVSAAGCAGTYSPKQEGVCNNGRVWVPPKKDDKGEWKAGYCAWADEAPSN